MLVQLSLGNDVHRICISQLVSHRRLESLVKGVQGRILGENLCL